MTLAKDDNDVTDLWRRLDAMGRELQARREATNADPKCVPEIRYDLDDELEGMPASIVEDCTTLALIWARRSGVAHSPYALQRWTNETQRRYQMHGTDGWIRRAS